MELSYEQLYAFDVAGWIVLPKVLSDAELRQCAAEKRREPRQQMQQVAHRLEKEGSKRQSQHESQRHGLLNRRGGMEHISIIHLALPLIPQHQH